MRKVILVVIGLLAIAYIVFSFKELSAILAALKQSRPLYLAIGVSLEAVLLINTAATFGALYRLVGINESGRSLFMLVTAATFVNLITPSYGIGGMAVFLDDAHHRNLSPGRVMVTGLLYVLYEYLALFFVLTTGFLLLAKLGKLNAGELLASGFLVVIAIALGIGLIVGYRSTSKLADMLSWLARAANRMLRPLRHKDSINVAVTRAFSHQLNDGLSSLRNARPGQILLPLVFTTINKILLILELGLAFLALDTPVSATTLVAGFSVGHLFVYASPTPSGIGFVDSILPLALFSLDIPLAQAVLVTLVYRGVTLWLPLLLGGLAFRTQQRSRARS